MNFERPIKTLESRIGRLRTFAEMRDQQDPHDAKMLQEEQREIEEHERAIGFLKAIIHIDTK